MKLASCNKCANLDTMIISFKHLCELELDIGEVC